MFGLDKDTGNLIIIISVLGILTCLCLWLLRSLNIILKNHDIKEVENYLSWIGVSLAFSGRSANQIACSRPKL